MEDLRPAATTEGHLQGPQAELRVKAVGEFPAQYMLGMEIHDRHQVQVSLLQWDGGDVGGPHLIHRRDLPEVHQAGKSNGWIACNRGSGFLVNRPQTHAAHEVSYPFAADRDPFSGQVSDHPPAAAAGILEVKSVDPGHDPQRRMTDRYRPVVERRTRKAQQHALPADDALGGRDRPACAIRGVRAYEIFI